MKDYIAKGATKIALFGLPPGISAAFDSRFAGAQEAIAEAGLQVLTEARSFVMPEAAQNLLTQYPDVDAIFSAVNASNYLVQPLISGGYGGKIMLSLFDDDGDVVGAFNQGVVTHVVEGVNAQAQIAFVLLYNALTENMMTKSDGSKPDILMPYLLLTSADEYNAFLQRSEGGIYSWDELKGFIKLVNSNASLDELTSAGPVVLEVTRFRRPEGMEPLRAPKGCSIEESRTDGRERGADARASVIMFVVLFGLSKAFGKGQFGSFSSLRIVAQQTMMGATIALAMTCNMKNGRWDFSIGMMTVMSAIIGGAIGQALNIGPIGLLIGCVFVAVAASAINGLLYIFMKVPTLVISIGAMLVYESVILVFNKGGGAKISDFSMLLFGRSPYVFILGIAAGIVFYVLYTHTVFGYNVRSLASNQALAASTGINEKRNVLGATSSAGSWSASRER